MLSKARLIYFREAGGTVNILLRKLRIPGLCCYTNFHPVEMGHSTKPNFFSENKFESVQILEQLLTEITAVCAVSHKKETIMVWKNVRTNAPVMHLVGKQS